MITFTELGIQNSNWDGGDNTSHSLHTDAKRPWVNFTTNRSGSEAFKWWNPHRHTHAHAHTWHYEITETCSLSPNNIQQTRSGYCLRTQTYHWHSAEENMGWDPENIELISRMNKSKPKAGYPDIGMCVVHWEPLKTATLADWLKKPEPKNKRNLTKQDHTL